jgi:hypothetical protein
MGHRIAWVFFKVKMSFMSLLGCLWGRNLVPVAEGTIASARSANSSFNSTAFAISADSACHMGKLEYERQSSIIGSTSGFAGIAAANSWACDAGIHSFEALPPNGGNIPGIALFVSP